jgi:pimeloyl-ACP methyl ester carboxylesterase
VARIATAWRVVLIVLSIPVGCIVILLGVLLAFSPGKPKPFVDGSGKVLSASISEKIHVNINGVQQGMFIKGRDFANPVLLFLHGGTAMPEYFLAQKYPTGLEQYFTVCWWERRGAGLSYRAGIPAETMSPEQSIADTIAVTNYLRARFHKDKIYLMAHCGGTEIAVQAAAKAPDLYAAYIGVAQMTYQVESEMLAYQYMVQKYREQGNTGMVRQLESAPPTMNVPLPDSYMKLRDKAMHDLGVGTMRQMKSVITGVFLASWLCPDYTLGEKLAMWKGKFAGDKLLWNTMISLDLTKKVVSLDIPAYFFHGRYDYTASYPLAKAYLKELRAPVKGFYTFEQSAHSPMFEEPARMRQIMETDVLAGKTSLADGT